MANWLPSPNFDSREGAPVTMLVLHYTGMRSAQEAIDRLRDPQAQVSAHYVVEESGTIHQLVQEEMRAWHAGVSAWRGVRQVNAHSIGLEIVNPGHEFGYRAFPAVQMNAVVELCQGILVRHPGIEPRNVVGHSDVAPTRKEDPGELFDWEGMAKQGIGLWPGELAMIETNATDFLHRDLALYGYDIVAEGVEDAMLTATVRAFQRHFRPGKIDGIWDAACAARLDALLRMV